MECGELSGVSTETESWVRLSRESLVYPVLTLDYPGPRPLVPLAPISF